MKSIRVLHTEWSDGWGGQEIRILQEMLSMRDNGIEVFLACRKKSLIFEKSTKSKIPTFPLPFRGNIDIKTIFELKKIIKQNKISIVNTHSGKDTWVGGFAAKLSGVKFIRTRHLSNPINSSKLNFINRLADYIVTTGEKVKDDMIKNNNILPQKIISIPTGPDEEIFDPRLFSKAESRLNFGIHGQEIAIGMLAVLRQFKRHDLFLNMAKELIDKYPSLRFRFLIAGDGPQMKNIKNQVADLKIDKSISLLGHINNQAEFLNALDLFILCSDSGEGVPQSLMQALMMNLEIISSDAGSILDLYHKRNLRIVRAGSQNSLNQEVIKFFRNSKNDISTPTSKREFIIQNFSKKQMIEKTLKIYQEILDR